MDKNKILEQIRGGLILSCQARPGNPLRGSEHMAAMAAAAELGGAVAIRADGPDDIAAIKRRIHIPVIGIYKTEPSPEFPYITPDFAHAEAIAKLGVEIIALDATIRPRPDGTDVNELIARVKNELGVLVMADIATFEEGVAAAKAGADIVATTLSGYTLQSKMTKGPDYELIHRLKAAIDTPIIAEGRFTTPEHLAEGCKAGAHAVVIGKAITNVQFTTDLFLREAREL
jgi:putative N-acetylmannosamine-6-phosphate epimerase